MASKIIENISDEINDEINDELEDAEIEDSEGGEESEELSVNSEGYVPPLKAIRQKCLDCCCYQNNEVKLCPCETCALWPYRFGKNPFRKKRQMSDEQKAAFTERVKKAREAKG